MTQTDDCYHLTRLTLCLLLCACAAAYPNRPIRNRGSEKTQLVRLLDDLRNELGSAPRKEANDPHFFASDTSYPAAPNHIPHDSRSGGIFDTFPQQRRNTQFLRLLTRNGNSQLTRSDNSLVNSNDNSVVEKRQGSWDYDYGLGGGRFGKRGYFDYNLGGGRFGRDVSHVNNMDDDVDFED